MNPKLLSLAPTGTLDPEKDQNFKAYNDHLTGVYNDDSLCNIALIGNRGSGKSSILRSFDARRHGGQRKFLYISLTDFEGGAGEKKEDDPEQTRKRLEYSLLCQILARCTADDLKNSTLKGIPEIRKGKNRFWRYAWFLLTGLLLFGLTFEDRFGAVLRSWGVSNGWRVGLHALGYVLAFLSVAGGFLWMRRKMPELIPWSKLTIKTPNADAELTPGGDKYCLDQFKFELIYILNQISDKIGCTVVFEDMERIHDKAVCTRIMTRLRELNALTNTHRSVQTRHAHPPIRFIYALSDELFDYEERTKFFDTIVPVVPVVNATNSRKNLENMISSYGVLVTSEEMGRLLDVAAPCLTDYRMMRNVITEFLFFRERYQAANGSKADNGQCIRILAVCVYKCLFPGEYHDAFTEKGYGFLPIPEGKAYPEKFVEMARKMTEMRLLDMDSLVLIGYLPAQIEAQWENILLHGDSQSQYSLLFRFCDPRVLQTPDGMRFRTLIGRKTFGPDYVGQISDPGMAGLVGNIVFSDVTEALAEFVLWVSHTPISPAEFINRLAMLKAYDLPKLQAAIDAYCARTSPNALSDMCIGQLERLELSGTYYHKIASDVVSLRVENKSWTSGPHIAALCMLLGERRNDLPEHLLNRKIGEKPLRQHIEEFNRNHSAMPDPCV